MIVASQPRARAEAAASRPIYPPPTTASARPVSARVSTCQRRRRCAIPARSPDRSPAANAPRPIPWPESNARMHRVAVAERNSMPGRIDLRYAEPNFSSIRHRCRTRAAAARGFRHRPPRSARLFDSGGRWYGRQRFLPTNVMRFSSPTAQHGGDGATGVPAPAMTMRRTSCALHHGLGIDVFS